MLKNYFKIAIAVLQRRKFFTFISLFGISFTLTVLMVLAAFIDQIANNNYPDKKRARCLYVDKFQERNTKKGYTSMGPPSFYLLDHYAGSLKTPVKIAISSNAGSTNTYINNKKIGIDYKYTNAAWWEVLDFDFLEGKPYTREQIKNGELVTVISDDIKKEYFGNVPSVVGKYIEADNMKYRISGVVRTVPITADMMHSDIYLPYTVSKQDYSYTSYRGNYSAILLAASEADVPAMKREYAQMIQKLPVENKDYDKIYSVADTYFKNYVSTGQEGVSGITIVITAIAVFALLFMLLPTLNLVNINITRIMERSSEIGVRKAFGASSKTLVYQFLVENLILTISGGVIAIVLSLIIITAFNSSNLVPHLELSLNLTVLFYSLLVCLFFGLLSGVYPAWRMSRLNVVTALKAQ